MGGFAGAAVAKAGFSALIFTGIRKILIFIVLSPLIGFGLGFTAMVITYWLFRKFHPSTVDRYFRLLQLVSAAAFSLGHGTNDAQKTMGIIAILLFSAGYLGDTFYVPWWVIIAAYSAISLGTLLGGWRVIKTLGIKVTKLKPVGGFCAESSAAFTLIGTALTGIPVSTTHTITGSILGVGSTVRLSAVRWGVARNIVWAWVLTIPGAFAISFGTYLLIELFI
jgi:PiT family inorganic phosphate transporter